MVHRFFRSLLLKRTVSYTPPLCRRGGRGVRLFFYYAKREDVKSSFTSSLLGYILFLVPLLSTPHYLHIHKDIVVSAPLLRGKELGRGCWVTFYLLSHIDWTNAVHIILVNQSFPSSTREPLINTQRIAHHLWHECCSIVITSITC